MIKEQIDSSGKWLRRDAGLSYKRALRDGMPTGGIVSTGAGRTFAQQMALYVRSKAGGNLAAYPGPKARHMTGIALDLTRNSLAQLWAVSGGDPLKVHGGEKLRIHDYGWRRTVPSEPWHFQYFPELDMKLPVAPAFPLERGAYFGPEKPLWRIKSVSGKYRNSADLRKWQIRAKAVGYDVDVTGRYDTKTANAAKAMQMLAGQAKDGLIGRMTWPLPWDLYPRV